MTSTDSRSGRRVDGIAAIFVAVYALFAVAAGARSLFQISTKFSDAPLAYSLSAVAAIIYGVAAYCFSRPSTTSFRAAFVALVIELVGVIGVGLLSVLVPEDFPDATVWSGFGQGYGYVPLVIPIAGLWWLTRKGTQHGFHEGRLR